MSVWITQNFVKKTKSSLLENEYVVNRVQR